MPMSISREALDAVLMFTQDAKKGDRDVLKHVHVSADGAELVGADGFTLGIATATEADLDLAGRLLDAEALRAFLRGVGTKYKASQVVSLTLHADGDKVAAHCGQFTALIPLIAGLSFPQYGLIVDRINLTERTEPTAPSFSLNATYMERIGKAFKPFGPMRVYPAPDRRDPVMFAAGAMTWSYGEQPFPKAWAFRAVVAPMFVSWAPQAAAEDAAS